MHPFSPRRILLLLPLLFAWAQPLSVGFSRTNLQAGNLLTVRLDLAPDDEFVNAWENDQPGRHEFYRGEVFAMVGARRVHGLVGGNLFAALKSHLKGSPCRAFVEGMKVQVADDAIFYPDVFVTCDAADLKTDMVFRQPRLVVEVLSDST
ncbi:MAG: Uma2 family endonuclease, partial [Spirochaetes bacterium]|nr:Uma2 family endonuclease [Spirochaetota bacterium]